MKANYLFLLLVLCAAAQVTHSRFQAQSPGGTSVAQAELPTQGHTGEHRHKIYQAKKEGLSICGFRPGMLADDVVREFPNRFTRSKNRLSSEVVALELDDSGKVVLGIVGDQGSVVEKDGVQLFPFSAGYQQAKELVEKTPGFQSVTSSFFETKVKYGSQTLRLLHFAQSGPNGNKGLLSTVVLMDTQLAKSP